MKLGVEAKTSSCLRRRLGRREFPEGERERDEETEVGGREGKLGGVNGGWEEWMGREGGTV